ncbi:Rad9-domain-containing protein [Schizothecium vesticola]|uniref:DNA repair protein rad9 n=1 Tax=Schizothecium vesticola TaxID=314040 RepID=A0AA40EH59_9PEZI|nr:Rad9-domain-containing protein [Schizothecium vesticola]
MTVLNFTLNEEGIAVLHDALTCMFKFSDELCLEAKGDKLVLTTLNISKSAYVCFTFAANRFFSRYNFEGNAQYRDRFYCQLYIRSLLSVFRARQGIDPGGHRETTIERCDVAIDDGPGIRSRLIARIVGRNGITATHSLAFEPKAPTHAKFDMDEATNHWALSSSTLRQLMDYFGPGIELLDINTDYDRKVVNFTCFTEKVQKKGANSNEAVLKKPLHTNIAVEMEEFDKVEVQDKLHIIISVKDFRAILQHAQVVSGELTTSYSNPGRPMKLTYSSEGLLCEFILMTVGEKDAMGQKHKNPRANSAAPKGFARPELDAGSRRGSSVGNENRTQPGAPGASARSAARQKSPVRSRQPGFEIRPQPMAPPPRPLPPPSASEASDSLFVAQDEDQKWEPLNPDEEEEENGADRLEWNSNNEPNPSTMRISSYVNHPTPVETEPEVDESLASGLEPTQRLSEVRQFGLFSN